MSEFFFFFFLGYLQALLKLLNHSEMLSNIELASPLVPMYLLIYLKKKILGGGVLIAHPKSKNASIPASCNGYSCTWF